MWVARLNVFYNSYVISGQSIRARRRDSRWVSPLRFYPLTQWKLKKRRYSLLSTMLFKVESHFLHTNMHVTARLDRMFSKHRPYNPWYLIFALFISASHALSVFYPASETLSSIRVKWRSHVGGDSRGREWERDLALFVEEQKRKRRETAADSVCEDGDGRGDGGGAYP